MNSRHRNKISTQSMQKKILLERLLTVITIILIGNNTNIMRLKAQNDVIKIYYYY